MEKRIVSLLISALLVFSSVSMPIYALPDDIEQSTTGENAEEYEYKQESNQQIQNEQNSEESSDNGGSDSTLPNPESSNPQPPNGDTPQEEPPITIELQLGKNNRGTLTITGNDAHHDAHLTIESNDEYATLKLEKDEQSDEWSVAKCDTYSGKVQSILRIIIAVMIGCSVSFLGLAIIIKFGRN